MTEPENDDELGGELSAVLHTLAGGYDAAEQPTVRSPRRRRTAIALAAAAAVVVIGGGAVALSAGGDDAADLDVRGDPAETAVPTTTQAATEATTTTTSLTHCCPVEALEDWTWSVGSPAPIWPRGDAEVVWTGEEVAVSGGYVPFEIAYDLSGAAYDVGTDTWRELGDDTPAAMLADPDPRLGDIRSGTVEATPIGAGSPEAWWLAGDGNRIELPPLPERFAITDASAVWTGTELVVWGGLYDCGPGALCAHLGPSAPFILRPPETLPPPVDPTGVFDRIAETPWMLDSAEIDGAPVPNDEPEALSLTFVASRYRTLPAPFSVSGVVGCDLAAALRIDLEGQVEWTTTVDACPGPVSTIATQVREVLPQTTNVELQRTGWGGVFLVLVGDGVRLEFADGEPPAEGEPAACGDIGFAAETDDGAWDIVATGVTCAEANDLVGRVAAEHNFYSGPRSFESGDYACTVETEDDELPVGHYVCRNDNATVTWDKT